MSAKPVTKIIVQLANYPTEEDISFFKPYQNWKLLDYQEALGILTNELTKAGFSARQHEISKQNYINYITTEKRLDIPAHRAAFIVRSLGMLPPPDSAQAAYSLSPIILAALYSWNGLEVEERRFD
jgi:hypothetical protein